MDFFEISKGFFRIKVFLESADADACRKKIWSADPDMQYVRPNPFQQYFSAIIKPEVTH